MLPKNSLLLAEWNDQSHLVGGHEVGRKQNVPDNNKNVLSCFSWLERERKKKSFLVTDSVKGTQTVSSY